MPLISCPDCEAKISDQAAACIQCGYPLTKLPSKILAQSEITPSEEISSLSLDKGNQYNKTCCPSCKCTDWKLASLIHRDGVSVVQSVSTGVGISTAGIGVGGSKSGGTSQTALSALAAPPVNPRQDIIQGMLVMGSLLVGGIGYLAGGFPSMWGGFFLGGSIGLGVGMMVPNTAYEAQYANWQKVVMCLRCGTFYVPPDYSISKDFSSIKDKFTEAIRKEDTMEIKQFLDSKLISSSGKNENGRGWLQFATGLGNTESCRILLMYGSMPDDKDELGKSANEIAIAGNNIEIVQMFSNHSRSVGQQGFDSI